MTTAPDTSFSDLENLVNSYSNLKFELDSANQALHECRRQIKTANALELEYKEEIRILEENEEHKKLLTTIQQLEERNQNLKSDYNERIISLEKDLEVKDDEVAELRRQISDFEAIVLKTTPFEGENYDHNFILQEQNVELSVQLEEMQATCQEYEEKCKNLEVNKVSLQNELTSFKEALDCKREELSEANSLIQTLKDEVVCLNAELDSLKRAPLEDKSQGNSLFAEVNDRRVQLQNNMTLMKTQYLEMKRERSSLLNDIRQLRNQNNTLIAQWEAEVNQKSYNDKTILNSYKLQITTLNEMVESYKKELSCKQNPNENLHKHLDAVFKSKNEEIEEWRERLSARAVNQCNLAWDLAEANRKIFTHKLDITQLENKLAALKSDYDDLKARTPLTESNDNVQKSEVVETEKPKSIIKTENKISRKTMFVDLTETTESCCEDKENENRKVKFSEDTVEPSITYRGQYKRGAKVHISNPIQIVTKKIE